MPKNLRHIFRSELIKQRKSGLRVARDAIKKSKNGKYADFYYNGYEENFKILSEPGYEEDSWENEDCGRTPKVLKKNGVSPELIEELIEGYYN